MQIRAEEISQIIRKEIEDFDQKVARSWRPAPCSRPATASPASTASTARWPASCSTSATATSSGLVLNLEEDNVGVALLGNFEAVKEGDTVKRTGRSPRSRSATR